jgi:hypothetical protein
MSGIFMLQTEHFVGHFYYDNIGKTNKTTTMKKTVKITFRAPEGLRDEITNLANNHGVSTAQLIRNCLRILLYDPSK